jgi:hypothetical protein
MCLLTTIPSTYEHFKSGHGTYTMRLAMKLTKAQILLYTLKMYGKKLPANIDMRSSM